MSKYWRTDAYQLPFEENTFDGCQSSRAFKHLASPDRALARKMIHLACDHVRQGWMGRQLPKLFSEAGLHDIVVTGHMLAIDYAYFQMVFGGLLQEAQTAGKVSSEEVTRFWNELSQADREQRLFGYVGFVVGGRKP